MNATILWYGGSPCSGKSTTAQHLATKLQLHHYCCDDHLDRHIHQAAERGLPMACQLRNADHQFIFMRTHEENLLLTCNIYHEIFPDILTDLLAYQEPVLAEGAALLPERLAALGVATNRALFQIPSEAFQRDRYQQRPWIHDRLQETSDPEQAFENWMRRDVAYAKRIATTADACGYHVQHVDLNTDFDHLQAAVCDWWTKALLPTKPSP